MGSRFISRSASTLWRCAAPLSPAPIATMPRDRAARPLRRRLARDAPDTSDGIRNMNRINPQRITTRTATAISRIAPIRVEPAYSRPPNVTKTVPG